MPHSGSCLCGGVRYELDVPLTEISVCHCRMCRKASGTAFVAVAPVPADKFRLVAGAAQMQTAPWTLLFPALFMAVTLFCFNFIGDGLRDALDPRDR